MIFLKLKSFFELQKRLLRFKNILRLLPALRNIEQSVVELRRIRPIEDDAVGAVGPDCRRGAFGVHVALELLDAVLALGLFALDDDLWE